MPAGQRDVIIVGGGIAGSTLATRLARSGRAVTLIESRLEFDDRVRGEGIMPWGAAEVRKAGVHSVLEAAGATKMRRDVGYAVGQTIERSEASPSRLDELVEGTGGGIAIRHPIACAALFGAAAEAGAETIRGYDALEIADDNSVMVTVEGTETRRTAPLLVGADGRGSRVRRHAGITLQKHPARHFIAGLLVEFDADPLPAQMATATGDERFMVYFKQGDNTHRVYLCGDADDMSRYSGSAGRVNFLDDMRTVPVPKPEIWATARPVGPCAAIRADDSVAERTHRDGIVLIGDAAGYASPITGQGLSIAFADVNDVYDAIDAAGSAVPDFDRYQQRKRHRLNTIRWATEFISAARAERCSNRARRITMTRRIASADPRVLPAVNAVFKGPHAIHADDLPWEAIDQLRETSPAAEPAVRRS